MQIVRSRSDLPEHLFRGDGTALSLAVGRRTTTRFLENRSAIVEITGSYSSIDINFQDDPRTRIVESREEFVPFSRWFFLFFLRGKRIDRLDREWIAQQRSKWYRWTVLSSRKFKSKIYIHGERLFFIRETPSFLSSKRRKIGLVTKASELWYWELTISCTSRFRRFLKRRFE